MTRTAAVVAALCVGCGPYADGLPWYECDEGECLDMEVPVDHDRPDGATLVVQVARYRATGDRIGPLVMNYGGPGAPATSGLVTFAESYPELAERFDLVALDPRLTPAGSPLASCMPPLDALMETEFDAVSGEAFEAQRDARGDWLAGCRDAGGDVADHMGTLDTVGDFEHLRGLLGDEPFTYVGFSYGTVLGQVYAEHHPDALRAVYLDGVGFPGGAYETFTRGQARGFQESFESWAAWCTANPGDCPVSDDPEATVTDLLAELRESPMEASSGRELTYARAWHGIIGTLYHPVWYVSLATALDGAWNDSPDQLLSFGDGFVGTDGAGNWWHGFATYYLTQCHDLALPEDEDALIAAAEAAEAEDSDLFGAGLVMEALTCMAGGAANDPLPATVDASGAPPILLVGGEHDPATPYAVAVAVSEALDDAQLLTWTGTGHVAFGESACVTDAAYDYLIDLELPSRSSCD